MERVSSENDERIALLIERVDEAIERKQWDEAHDQLSQLLAVSPDHPEALGLLAHVERRRKTAPPHLEAARRAVTVVFCDLVGSTKMAKRLDPEAMQEILSWYQRIVGETWQDVSLSSAADPGGREVGGLLPPRYSDL